MDAVGAADDRGVLELDGAALEDICEGDDAGADDGGGFFELEGLGGVDDVGGGEAVVEPARVFGGVNVLGDGGGEGNDVVADFGFDLVDAVDGKGSLVADGVGGGLWDEAEFGKGLGGGDFDSEPAAVFVLVGPDAAHGGASVAGYQGDALQVSYKESVSRLFYCVVDCDVCCDADQTSYTR